MKYLRCKNLVRLLPGLLAVAALLLTGISLDASASKAKAKSSKAPAKKEPPKKAPPAKCKPCHKCQPKPRPKATAFGGQASVIYFTNLHVGPAQVIIADTGPLPSAGGHRQASAAETNILDGALQLDLGHASTRGGGTEARSEASVCGLIVVLQTVNHGQRVLGLEYLCATAEAECSSKGVELSGKVCINGLTLDGVAVHVTGEVNQVVEFAGGKLIINYRASSKTSTEGTITVAGVVVLLDDCLAGTIGLVRADIVCGTTPPVKECHDFVTGGGYIFGTPSGERANFSVGGGVTKKGFWGHLNYIDHGTGMHVKSTRVTGYESVDATTRLISYDVTIDGAAGTALVLVTDAGEPGTSDTFAIQLSTDYEASGDLGGADSGGGNIQLHRNKCRCKVKCHRDEDDYPKGDRDDDDDDGKGKGGHDDDDDDGKGKGGHDDDDDGGGKGKGGHDDDDDDDKGKGHHKGKKDYGKGKDNDD